MWTRLYPQVEPSVYSCLSPCHPIFTDKKVSQPTFLWVSLTKMTKMVQWPILNNSHAYPFCKTTPGTQLFSIGHCTIFCQWNSLKMVAKLFSQWKSGCTTKSYRRSPKCHTSVSHLNLLCSSNCLRPVDGVIVAVLNRSTFCRRWTTLFGIERCQRIKTSGDGVPS